MLNLKCMFQVMCRLLYFNEMMTYTASVILLAVTQLHTMTIPYDLRNISHISGHVSASAYYRDADV